MTEFSDAWGRQRQLLAYNYVDESGEKASCWKVAVSLCALLHNEGQIPRLVVVQSEGTTIDDFWASELNPVPYPDKSWWYHYVCAEGELFYDPMLEEPLNMRDYPALAFNVPRVEIVQNTLWKPL